MAERPFLFEIYRLNIVDEGMLPFMGQVIRDDSEIVRVLAAATDSRFDKVTESRRGTFKWSLREFVSYDLERDGGITTVVGLTFARSVISQSGQTVTDFSIEDATSELSP